MDADYAHKSRWRIAEVVFGAPFLVSLVLHFVVPSALPRDIFSVILLPTGIVLIGAGLSLIVLARRALAKFRQPTDPGHPTTRVVRTGVFAISRNPLYLGSVLVLLGTALALNLLWALVTLPLSIVLCHTILIGPEERYLAAKFGAEYTEYAASVRRWLGRK
jgi:protein-S-isoprenylcysteine O-methyltransferase Ste14